MDQPRAAVDPDDLARAQVALLGAGRPGPRTQVDAYRVLAQDSPKAYLPLLVQALLSLSWEREYIDQYEGRLVLYEEALEAAQAMDPDEPSRAELLYRVLDSCQSCLYVLGRRDEGLARRAQMAEAGRMADDPTGGATLRGLAAWAAGLADAGRHAEAADALTEGVAGARHAGARSGAAAWYLMDLVAELEAADRPGEALAAFEELVTTQTEEAAHDRAPMVCAFHAQARYAQMLDERGRTADAALARREALATVTELAEHGERKTWSGYQATYWTTVLHLSCADEEAPTTPTRDSWMRGVRDRYFDALDALEDLGAGDEDGPLVELIRKHRIRTVRSAVSWDHRHRPSGDTLESLFDEGVRLARRAAGEGTGSGPLVLALTDRSTFHAATHAFASALRDFREVTELAAAWTDASTA